MLNLKKFYKPIILVVILVSSALFYIFVGHFVSSLVH